MLIANAVFAGSQFAMLVALTGATSPEVVGKYALSLAVTAPAYFAANLKLRQVAISDTEDQFTAGQYVGTRLSAIGLVWVALGLVSLVLPMAGLLLAVSTLKALDMTSDILYALPHRRGHLLGIAVSMSTRGVVSVGVFIAILQVGGGAALAVWGAVVVYAAAAVCDFSYARCHGDPRPDLGWSSNKRLVRIAAPLGLAMALSSAGSMLPRYSLQLTQGAREVGIFSAVAYLLVMGGLVVNSMGQAAAPQLAKHLQEQNLELFRSDVRRLTLLGALLGVSGIVAAALFGGPVLRALFGAEYSSGATTLLLLAVAATLSYSAVPAGTALNALRRFDVPLPVTASSAVLAAALLIPATLRWGIEGAGAVAIVAATLELGLYWRKLRTEMLSQTQEQ